MAKNRKNVLEFLETLKKKLKPVALKELDVLLQLKKDEKLERGEPFDGKINSWDFQYYNRMLLEKEYQVDHETIKNYYPFDVVTKEMLSLYELVLGLKFEKVTDEFSSWHEDVQLFKVTDAKTSEMVGHFYLDLFPRTGKYSHAGTIFSRTLRIKLVFLYNLDVK
jgi:Zn-dependent oligopeptidase